MAAFALDFQQLLARYPTIQAVLAARVKDDPASSQLNVSPADAKLAQAMLSTMQNELRQVFAEQDVADWATAWPAAGGWQPHYRSSADDPGTHSCPPPRPGETIDAWRTRLWGTMHGPGFNPFRAG